jgi:polyhydroxyalkanoate synthesis repressor PhaR
VKDKKASGAERLIKRYENRKLYDPHARRYVTLEDLARMVTEGTEVKVVDQKTAEDITTHVLAQVALDGIKERTARLPRQVLTRLIRLGGGAAPKEGPRVDLAARGREEAERIVGGLISRGRLSLEEAVALRQEIAGSVQKVLADAQRALEGRLRVFLETNDEGVVPSLHALKERLLAFETYLTEAPGPRRPPAKPRTNRRRRRD